MPQELTVKQKRDARRTEKVAALKKREAAQKRNRLIVLILSSVAALAVVSIVVVSIVSGATPKPDPASIEIEGLQVFDDLAVGVHVDPQPVDYEAEFGMTPPAGGDHWQGWLNCGVYTEPQESERAVHSLEHGAVWVTYDPEALGDDDISRLRGSLPSTYVVLSPYPDLPAPVVASAWGAQIQLDGVDDERLGDFIAKFWKSPGAPEPNALCSGGVDGPGKIA